jgi:glycosyltransferase involved in cell wall biosynthesis
MKPRVSITMPVLNGEKYIDEAIESIAAQTYQNFELIVVDDGSTDQTPEHLKRFSGRIDLKCICHSERQGIARSVNDGIRQSSGEFIAFLDHDDAWFPGFLETQVAYLDQHPDVGMVHSDFQTIDPDGNILEESIALWRKLSRPSGHVFRQLFMDSFIVGNSVLIRKECLERLGGFDESLRFGDYLLWMRIARHYKIDYVGKVLTQYRQHPSQSTQNIAVTRPDEESVGIQSIQKIMELYPEIREELGERTIRRRLASLYFDLAYFWFSKGAFRNARICLIKCIGLCPADGRYYIVYTACLFPPPLVMGVRRAWHLVGDLFFRAKQSTRQSDSVTKCNGASCGRGI